jgi:TetR/AcrR family transcriptional regulator, cholesterol catabolism regulator
MHPEGIVTYGQAETSATRANRKREQIVSAAAALFDSRGYHATTMEDIATAVGIAKPTLYHYYRSKDEILNEIHEAFIDLLLAEHKQRAADFSLGPDELLEGIAGDILDLMETHRGHVRTFFEHHRELPARQRASIRRKRDRYAGIVENLLQQGVDQGIFDTDPKLCALHFFGMCNWAYQWYRSGDEFSPRSIGEEFWHMLRDGIGTRSKPASDSADSLSASTQDSQTAIRARRQHAGRASKTVPASSSAD